MPFLAGDLATSSKAIEQLYSRGEPCADQKAAGVHLRVLACGGTPSRHTATEGQQCSLTARQLVAIVQNDEISARRVVYTSFNPKNAATAASPAHASDPPKLVLAPARRGWLVNQSSYKHVVCNLVGGSAPTEIVEVVCIEETFKNSVTLNTMKRRRTKPHLRKSDAGVIDLEVEVEL